MRVIGFSLLLAGVGLNVAACATFGHSSEEVARCDKSTKASILLSKGAGSAVPCLITDDEAIPMREADYTLMFGHEAPDAPSGNRPFLGIALAGGGTKAADVAMGVLAGLEDA